MLKNSDSDSVTARFSKHYAYRARIHAVRIILFKNLLSRCHCHWLEVRVKM